jgi:hypothetical protein
LISRLDEPQRRWCEALGFQRVGHGGDRLLSQIIGLDEATIGHDRQQLASELALCPEDPVRLPGARHQVVEKESAIVPTLEAIVAPEMTGDPVCTEAGAEQPADVKGPAPRRRPCRESSAHGGQ